MTDLDGWSLQDAVDAAKETIGEDPCRYLGKPLAHDKNARNLARSRIRGLRDFPAVATWRAVEHRLARGPRDKVLEWLDERQAELDELGCREFDAYLADVERQETHADSVAQFIAPDGTVSDGRDRRSVATSGGPIIDKWTEEWLGDDDSVATDGGGER